MMSTQCNADLRKDDFMATKTLTTRIALKTDTTANWAASTLVLLKGEQAIEIPESGEYKIKIGDGVKTFKDLPYAAMTPTEIAKLISDSAVQTVSLASGTNNGTVKLTVDGTVTDNIAVKGLGSAAYTNSNAYATAGHNHNSSYYTKTEMDGKLGTKSNTGHTHTIADVTNLQSTLNGKANSSHTHGSGDITSLDAGKLTGTISIDRLPAGALERCMIVADDTARFKLTTTDVQKGDTVKVTSTGKMYFVIDDSKLTTEDGYTVYTAGSATSVPWSGVTGKPTTFTPSAHKHTKSEITDFPTSMVNPNSITVTLNGGTTEGTNKFTYNGGSAKTINITPANIGAAAASHGTHVTYSTDAPKANGTASAGTSGAVARADHVHPLQTTVSGNAGTATKLANPRKIGNASFDGSGDITLADIGAAASSHSHTIANVTGLQSALDGKASSNHNHNNVYYTKTETDNKLNLKAENITLTNQDLNSVTAPGFYVAAGGNTCANKPSNVDNFGLIVIHRASGAFYTQICFIDDKSYRRFDKNGTWTNWTEDKLTDTNTWRGIQDNLKSDSTDQSLSAAQGKVLKGLVDGKAAASHTHSISNITNLQSALDGKSNTNHTHSYAGAASAGGNAYNANALALNPATRPDSLNYDLTSNTYAKKVTYSIASKTTTKTGIPPVDGHMLTFGWDNNDGWGSQLIVGDGSEAHLYVRGASSTTVSNKKTTSWDQTWREILDSSNYISYTVTKNGSGASGTWGISITGNAATSSKCTGNAATATVADSAKVCTGNSATATKLFSAKTFSITGGAAASAISFDGSNNVALNVTSVSTDVLNNGSNTLILNCGGAA